MKKYYFPVCLSAQQTASEKRKPSRAKGANARKMIAWRYIKRKERPCRLSSSMSFKQTFFPLTATDFSDISTAERQTFESKILDKEKLSLYNGWLNKDDKYATDSSGAVNDFNVSNYGKSNVI